MVSVGQGSCGQEARRPEFHTSQGEKRLSTLGEVQDVLSALCGELEAAGYPEKDVFAVRLALDEALVNAVKHGNQGDPGKVVCVRYQITPESLRVEVEDQGEGFDPAQVPDPRAPENLERASGRGLFLMQVYMTWVHYNERGNAVTLCRYRTLA
jgi:serine/threonine-protein kinase RsbW